MGMEKHISILEHEHHVSHRHPRMSAIERAAQFAPFAALTGYDCVIRETGRETSAREDLDELKASALLTERPHASAQNAFNSLCPKRKILHDLREDILA